MEYWTKLKSLFAPRPRLIITSSYEAAVKTQLEKEAAHQRKMIDHMHQLGGFDTYLNENAQNWCRQLEIMHDHERRLSDLENAVAALRGEPK